MAWIFPYYNIVEYTDNSKNNYCDKSLFLVDFSWIIASMPLNGALAAVVIISSFTSRFFNYNE